MKESRKAKLLVYKNYRSVHDKMEPPGLLMQLFEEVTPDFVVHLAARAGVRYSIENPRSYLERSSVGTFELLEAAGAFPPKHMLLAPTSSAYEANTVMPFKETQRADHQVSFYAATKKSTEIIAPSYAHLFELPITMFRFFRVYGPWGRPDMSLFKFTKAIFENKPIDVYSHGNMKRDFTYVEDLVHAIRLLMDAVPIRPVEADTPEDGSLSPVAPYRVVNIGNNQSVQLTDFIEAIESATGIEAQRNLMPMQPGDVSATWADAEVLQTLTGYRPVTTVIYGAEKFIRWHLETIKMIWVPRIRFLVLAKKIDLASNSPASL